MQKGKRRHCRQTQVHIPQVRLTIPPTLQPPNPPTTPCDERHSFAKWSDLFSPAINKAAAGLAVRKDRIGKTAQGTTRWMFAYSSPPWVFGHFLLQYISKYVYQTGKATSFFTSSLVIRYSFNPFFSVDYILLTDNT